MLVFARSSSMHLLRLADVDEWTDPVLLVVLSYDMTGLRGGVRLERVYRLLPSLPAVEIRDYCVTVVFAVDRRFGRLILPSNVAVNRQLHMFAIR